MFYCYLKGKLTGFGQSDEILNVYISNPGHITKMVTMPIFGKSPSKIFSGIAGRALQYLHKS